MHTTSVSLLERLAQTGDNSDWQKLLFVYRPFIEKVVSGYPALASEADDVAQDVMLVLMRELPVFQRQRMGSFRSWLRQVTVNQLRMALRKTRRGSPVQGADGATLDPVEELADPHSVESQQWDEEHDRVVMQRVFDLVKPTVQEKTWMAFERYVIHDEPAQKVADELGLSLNSVLLAKSRILRSMRLEAKGLVDE
jgi:RNA polymerase sigma-70 factor, ECF subfamily